MTIIVAVDQSERAPALVTEAAKMSDTFDCPLHVVHVMSQSDFVDIERETVDKTGQAVDMDELKQRAEEVSREIGEDVVSEFEAVGLFGDVSKELIRYAETHGADYLVIGGRKRSPVGKALFGSVTQAVLLHSSVPVITVMGED